jgi:predicted RND superfamily exporter protein
MEKLKNIITTIIKFRIAIIVILAVLMGFSGYQTLKKLRVDNSLSIWFLEDDPSYKAYIDFQEKFGSDEIFIAMLPVENAIGNTEKSKLLKLHESIDSLSFVKTSFSLAKAQFR